MRDPSALPQFPPPKPGTDTISLFLGLYLLVLAFFILLVSISTLEEVKTKAVRDSLTSTFASVLPPTADLTAYTGQTGEVVAGQQFQELVAGLFASAVQVSKVTIVHPGRHMRVSLPTEALFVDDAAEVREAQHPLLDRLVASLSRRPPGIRFEMDFIIGSRYAVGTSLPIAQTMETARAGAFARQMRARGAPPDSVVIAVRAGSPEQVDIDFFVRHEDEIEALTFEAIPPPPPPRVRTRPTPPLPAPAPATPATPPADGGITSDGRTVTIPIGVGLGRDPVSPEPDE